MIDENEKPWGLLDCLDPVQLGFVYESLMKNASDGGMNSQSAKSYLQYAEIVRNGIDASYGWSEYEKHQQKLCRRLADYDGRMGWR